MGRAAVVRRFAGAVALVGVLGAASSAAAAASGWSIQQTPNPTGGTGNSLLGVSCPSGSACTAVGSYYNGTNTVTLAERWNGTKWTVQHPPDPSGAQSSSLGGVSCASASACTAVGSYSKGKAIVMLAERWNGTKWSIQQTPSPTGAKSSNLAGVSCVSGSVCTAVGYYIHDTNAVPLAERWNGSKWTAERPPSPAGTQTASLHGVSCAATSACSAVGDYSNGTSEVMLAERWNGTKWTVQHPPNPTGAQGSLLSGVSCAFASACTAIGGYSNGTNPVTLAERWNGIEWSVQQTPNPADAGLRGVSCASGSVCTAAGDYYPGNGINDVPLAERWNGTKWSIQHTPNPTGAQGSELTGVSCASASVCTAVGDYYNGTKGVTLAERWTRR